MTYSDKFKMLIVVLFSVFSVTGKADNELITNNLSVNFLQNTDRVYHNGYPTSVLLEDIDKYGDNFNTVEIKTKQPHLGWMLKSGTNNTLQTAYQIIVADNKDDILNNTGNVWDSGKVLSNESVNIKYEGNALEPGKVYFWRVKTWDNHGNESNYSDYSAFATAGELLDYYTDGYLLQKYDESPKDIVTGENDHLFADFGLASFGRVVVRVFASEANESLTIHLGEKSINNRVDREPGGTIRYSSYDLKLLKGLHTYIINIIADQRNTGSQAILMPDYVGEVTPFRYCEIEGLTSGIKIEDIKRETVIYPFNDDDSYFHSSDTVLNQVWDISKYSIKATSFAGIYVDGDRERIPYEADVLINQLSHYGVEREFSLARRSHEYLIRRPTWPTEWILQSVLIAWEDYKYTGNSASLVHFYDDLKAKTLTALADDDGFISTRTGKVTPEVLKSIHFDGTLNDIVDWPHTGILGLEKDEGGEADGYVFEDINTVVNAFHYRSLVIMQQVAQLLNKQDDYNSFKQQAERLKRNFNQKLFDKKRGVYVDGIGTDHASLHANMFPLALGLVPAGNVDSVLEFIRSRKMACSVYGSQFLMDALYNYNDGDYGLELLSSTSERSWYNMIASGSTITTEAWDIKYKPNQDWNHAWGAAPANVIPRKLMGIEPLEPGFGKFIIKPQPSTLTHASIKHPTIRGEVFVKFENQPGQSFAMEVEIPANTTADLYLPYYSSRQSLVVNNQKVKYKKKGNYAVVENVGSGTWSVEVKK